MKVIYIKNTANGTKEGTISGNLPLPTANSLIEKGLAVEYTENEIETELKTKKTKKEK